MFKVTLHEQVHYRGILQVIVCHTTGHYSEEYDDWNSASSGHGRTAAAMVQNEQMVEEHSSLEQQPSGRLNHPG